MNMTIPVHAGGVIIASTLKYIPCLLQYCVTQGWLTFTLALFSMCLVKCICLYMNIYMYYLEVPTSAKMCKCACLKANVTEE